MARTQKASIPGGHILKAQTLDGTTTSAYTDIFITTKAEVWAVHVVFSGGTSFTCTAALWATCIPNADEADDTDWVSDSDVTFTGITTGSAAKELIEIGNSGAGMYRIKFSRSAGDGVVDVYLSTKVRG